MLVIKFVPTFSDNSMLYTSEDVAWQFHGKVEEGEVYISVDHLLPVAGVEEPLYRYQVVKHLMLQLHLFGIGVKGCSTIDHTFDGKEGDFEVLYKQLAYKYKRTSEGLVQDYLTVRLADCSKRYYSEGVPDSVNKELSSKVISSYWEENDFIIKLDEGKEALNATVKYLKNKLFPSEVFIYPEKRMKTPKIVRPLPDYELSEFAKLSRKLLLLNDEYQGLLDDYWYVERTGDKRKLDELKKVMKEKELEIAQVEEEQTNLRR